MCSHRTRLRTPAVVSSRLSWLQGALCGLLLTPVSAIAEEEVLRDPTQPLGWRTATKAAPSQPKLQLQWILHSPERRLAIINGRQVRERGWVSGAQVVEIRPQTVVVRRDNRQSTLSLYRSYVDRGQ